MCPPGAHSPLQAHPGARDAGTACPHGPHPPCDFLPQGLCHVNTPGLGVGQRPLVSGHPVCWTCGRGRGRMVGGARKAQNPKCAADVQAVGGWSGREGRQTDLLGFNGVDAWHVGLLGAVWALHSGHPVRAGSRGGAGGGQGGREPPSGRLSGPGGRLGVLRCVGATPEGDGRIPDPGGRWCPERQGSRQSHMGCTEDGGQALPPPAPALLPEELWSPPSKG